MLITVYWRLEKKQYAKCIIPQEHTDFFVEKGAELKQPIFEDEPEPEKEEMIAVSVDPDKGFGKPGTLKWHETNILNFKTKKQIIAYVEDVTGSELFVGSQTMTQLFEKAMSTIKEHTP